MRFAINNVIKASEQKVNSQWNYSILIAFDVVECKHTLRTGFEVEG
jgi:hypothetical protein